MLIADGMTAFFHVKQCTTEPLPDTPPGKHRRYYIAAEEVNWNYLPGGKDMFTSGKIDMDHGFSRLIDSYAFLHRYGNYRVQIFLTYKIGL